MPPLSQQTSLRAARAAAPLSCSQLRGVHCSEGPLAHVRCEREREKEGEGEIGGDKKAGEKLKEGATKEGEG